MKSIIRIFFGWIKPNFYYESVFEINFEDLQKKNIKNILIDLDNTLVPWGEDKITERLVRWLRRTQEKGFNICVLSNNTEKRASSLNKTLGLPYVAFARKPAKKAFEKGLKMLKAKRRETVIIGDQIFTDILGGKRVGIQTVLVMPLSKNEFWGTKIARKFEKIILKALYE